MSSLPPTAAVLLAGGTSTRMGGATPKPFLQLRGKRIVDYSLEIFSQLPYVIEICIVCPEEYRESFPHFVTFAQPGQRRQDSVLNGIKALKQKPALVAIHDTARPLITHDLVERTISHAAQTGGAIAAVPVKTTIKRAAHNQQIEETPERSLLWEAQTPQVFLYESLIQAYEAPINHTYDAVDDASLVERIGLPVALVMGCYKNIKLTTPEDLTIAHHFIG